MNEKDVKPIFDCAVRIAGEIGFTVTDEQLRSRLSHFGFRTENKQVFISANDFRDYFRLWQARVRQQQRKAVPQDGRFRGSMNEYCSHLLLPGEKNPEPFTMERVIHETDAAMRLCAALRQPCGVVGFPLDIPPELQALARCMAAMYCTPQDYPSAPETLLTAPYMFELAELADEPIRRLTVYMATPLHFGGESVDIALQYADRIESIKVTSMPTVGCNAPLNAASALSLSLAECLGGALMMERMTQKPCDFLVQLHPFDFWSTNFVFGTPETALLSEMVSAFHVALRGQAIHAHRANIHVMAKTPGVQASAEKAMMIALGAKRGATLYQGLGALSLDEIYSPVELIIDAEMLDMGARYAAGWPLAAQNTDSMMGLILDGLHDGYMAADATLDHYDEAIWHSRLFTRQSLAAFTASGGKEALQKAEDMARSRHNGAPLYRPSAARLNDMLAVYADAHQKVTGEKWINHWLK